MISPHQRPLKLNIAILVEKKFWWPQGPLIRMCGVQIEQTSVVNTVIAGENFIGGVNDTGGVADTGDNNFPRCC